MKLLNYPILFLILSLTLISCKSPTDSEPDLLECNVEITSDVSGVEVASSVQLGTRVTSNKEKSECSPISWESNNSEIASVNNEGEVTGEKEGKVKIKACVSNGDKENCDSTEIDVFSYKIAFRGTKDANDDIFLSSSDGEYIKRITDFSGQDVSPAWKPNGEKISFVRLSESGTNVFISNPDGTSQNNITPDFDYVSQQSWSPDGSKIVASVKINSSDPFEIRTIDIETGKVKRLTFENVESGATPGYPHWSPDGSKIVYSTKKDNNWEIYKMNADGSNKENLTNSPDTIEGNPRWSPDGNKILFVKSSGIYTMNPDGSNKEKVIGSGGNASWTQDGRILYSKGQTGGYNIFIVDPETGDSRQITNTEWHNVNPVWKPSTN